jgi:hypothetical protein
MNNGTKKRDSVARPAGIDISHADPNVAIADSMTSPHAPSAKSTGETP